LCLTLPLSVPERGEVEEPGTLRGRRRETSANAGGNAGLINSARPSKRGEFSFSGSVARAARSRRPASARPPMVQRTEVVRVSVWGMRGSSSS